MFISAICVLFLIMANGKKTRKEREGKEFKKIRKERKANER